MNAELKIQEALYEALASSPGAGYEVFDDVPEGQGYPYIVIGEASSAEFDTKDSYGFETSVIIHSWSRFEGRQEVKQMMGAVYDILHDSYLVVEGYSTILCQWEFSETLLENDGITRHGIQRFNLIISQE